MDQSEYLSNFLPLMIRVILGILLFFQAYDKIFNIGLKEVGASVLTNDKLKKLPNKFIATSIWVSSFIELIAGALLIIGLFRTGAMIAAGINLIMVTLAFSFMKGIWDTQHVFIRVALLSALMLIPLTWDKYCLDEIIAKLMSN